MKLPLSLLLVLLSIVGLLVAGVFTLPQTEETTGVTHSLLKTMDQGGTGERHREMLWWGCTIGVLQIIFFVLSLGIGIRGSKRKEAGAWLAFGGLCYAGIFGLMVAYYQSYLMDPSFILFGLPAPTTVMLFLLWPFPFFFVMLYVFRFKDWIFSPDDLIQFKQIRNRLSVDLKEDL